MLKNKHAMAKLIKKPKYSGSVTKFWGNLSLIYDDDEGTIFYCLLNLKMFGLRTSGSSWIMLVCTVWLGAEVDLFVTLS